MAHATRLSIITPVYNTRPAHLEALARSIKEAAADEDFEWLLIDDHSDRTATRECLDRLVRPPAVRVLTNERSKGAAAARNFGAYEAAGDLLAFVDADDLLVPGSLSRMIDVMTRRPEIRWLSGDFEDFEDKTSSASPAPAELETDPTVEHWPAAAERLVFETLVNAGTFIIDRELLLQVGGFDERFVVGEDWYLWMRLAAQRQLYHWDSLVMLRRRGHSSIMSGPLMYSAAIVEPYLAARKDQQFASLKKLLRWRIYRLYRLLAQRNQALARRGDTIRFAWLAALWAVNEPRQWLNLVRSLVGRPLC